MKKTHYEILGVREDAELQVIRAAYKALAQMYHPDKYDGDKAEANKKMADLNIAYETLSDSTKIAAYDNDIGLQAKAQRSQESSRRGASSNPREEAKTDDHDAWQIASKVYPDIEICYRDLRIVNSALASEFKDILLRTKSFQHAQRIASEMINNFLARYFGDNEEIKGFALQIVRSGNKAMARYLNEVVAALGPSATMAAVRKLFVDKFPHHMKNLGNFFLGPNLLNKIKKGQLTTEEAIALIHSLGGKVQKDGYGKYSASVNGANEAEMGATYLRSRFLQKALLRPEDF